MDKDLETSSRSRFTPALDGEACCHASARDRPAAAGAPPAVDSHDGATGRPAGLRLEHADRSDALVLLRDADAALLHAGLSPPRARASSSLQPAYRDAVERADSDYVNQLFHSRVKYSRL